MTSKEMKHLRRSDLLEMLLEMSKENEKLKEQNEFLRKKLMDRKIAIENSGSLAEAALQLSGIFQAAEDACTQYTENIRARSADLEEHCRRREQETEEACRRREQQTEEACHRMVARAKEEIRQRKQEAMRQQSSRGQEYDWLADLLKNGDTE